jgi:hypothetical protein
MWPPPGVAAAAAQVVVDGLEPSYLVLRNPLLPAITFEQAEPQEAAAHTAGPNDSPFGHFETLHSSRLMGVSGKDNDKIHARAQVRLLMWVHVMFQVQAEQFTAGYNLRANAPKTLHA